MGEVHPVFRRLFREHKLECDHENYHYDWIEREPGKTDSNDILLSYRAICLDCDQDITEMIEMRKHDFDDDYYGVMS